jgi:hypothetical protein
MGHFIADHDREKQTIVLHSIELMIPWLPLTKLSRLLPSSPIVAYWRAKWHAIEHEADYIGLLLMTDTGYDPAAAISTLKTLERWKEHQFQDAKRRAGPFMIVPGEEDPICPTIRPFQFTHFPQLQWDWSLHERR